MTMKNEIRQAERLPLELEDKTFDMQAEAFELLEDGKPAEAVAKIKEAWDLLPEPKFNTSCSYTILCDLIEILMTAGKHEEAHLILEEWIDDLENCGYKILETTPYILSGENYLYLNQPEKAKGQFYKAVKYKATKRDFSEKPAFYFDIAKKVITDNIQIERLFDSQVRHRPRMTRPDEGLQAETVDRIEELSEQGNEYFDEEKYVDAIRVWEQALTLIPNPRHGFAESQWLETSLGDAHFLLGNHANALECFQNAKNNLEANAYENPFIMLRLGQTYLENQQHDEAKEYLLRAYMLEGEEVFELDDPKYIEFLKQHVDLK